MKLQKCLWFLVLIVALSAGCSGDGNTNTDGGSDGNNTKKDSSTTLPDSSGGDVFLQPDLVTQPDGNNTTDKVTCLEVLTCIGNNRCQTQTCVEQCATGAGQSTLLKLNALATCIQGAQTGSCKNECSANPQSQGCLTCAQNACGTEATACQSDDGNDTVNNDTSTCSGLNNCVTQCANITCQQQCISSAPSNVQSVFNAVQQCVQTAAFGSCKDKCTDVNSQPCQQCYNQACQTEITTCVTGKVPSDAAVSDTISDGGAG